MCPVFLKTSPALKNSSCAPAEKYISILQKYRENFLTIITVPKIYTITIWLLRNIYNQWKQVPLPVFVTIIGSIYFQNWFLLVLYKKHLWAIKVYQCGVKLPELSLFVLSLLRVSKKSCFKAPKVPIGEYFYHWNVHFGWFCIKNQLWVILVWESERGTPWILFICVIFIVDIMGKLF